MTESTGARGRLAQMIASRGGLARPEAPFVIEHREALIYMLCQAAELEHGIMCQYLYAAFSLKQSEAEGLTSLRSRSRPAVAQAHIPHRHAGDAAHVAGAEPAVGHRRGPAPVPAELPAARQPLPGRSAPGAAAVRRGVAAPLHVPRAPRGDGHRGRGRDGRLREGRARDHALGAGSATSSRAARTSPPSGTCTGPSRRGSRTWRTTLASRRCSSARRGRRPRKPTSAGPSWSR